MSVEVTKYSYLANKGSMIKTEESVTQMWDFEFLLMFINFYVYKRLLNHSIGWEAILLRNRVKIG